MKGYTVGRKIKKQSKFSDTVVGKFPTSQGGEKSYIGGGPYHGKIPGTKPQLQNRMDCREQMRGNWLTANTLFALVSENTA